MDELIRFLQQYESGVYFLAGGVGLIYLWRLLSAWEEYRKAVFGIEREIARRKILSALTIMGLMVLMVFAEFVLVSFVVPSYLEKPVFQTPTLNLLETPQVSLTTPQPGTPTPSNLIMTVAPSQEGCIEGQIEWVSPRPGDELEKTVELKGTVNVPNLGFFKYEYASVNSEDWVTIAADNRPKVNALIGYWDVSQIVPGDYRLRLVVTDNQNNVFPACVIQVRVINSP